MPDTILLRFRDLTGDDTIGSHRAIISQLGYVWWGWWKKESEPSRDGELKELNPSASGHSLEIGLFDRKERRYFSAIATDCRVGLEPIHSPEQRCTPKYYANEKVAAWLKLQSIEDLDEAEFQKRFGVLPIGDGTLFPIWKGSPVTSAAIGKPTKLDTCRILHLSDIHLGADYGFPSSNSPGQTELVEIIVRDLKDRRPSLVVVSGDITSRADANVLQSSGVNFLKELAKRLSVPREQFVIVPGNHDIALNKFVPFDYSHEKPFFHFMRDFYGRDIDFPNLNPFLLPDGLRLEILTMNSVKRRDEKESNFGYVDWNLYADLLKAKTKDPSCIRVAVLHHHLLQAPRVELVDPNYSVASVSTTLDAADVIEGLQLNGFDLVLHGHQHVPALSRVSRAVQVKGSNSAEFQKDLYVLAAGSAGSSRLSDEMRDNSYNVLEVTSKGVEVEARLYNKGKSPRTLFKHFIANGA
jgi:3',5'-cyclic AMP phosphodiesterase CpdA